MRPHWLAYWPAFRAGLLLHLAWGTVLLAVAVIFGPPLAWILGQQLAAAFIAVLSLAGRAVIGVVNARPLWQRAASAGLCLRTTLLAACAGHLLVFGPLALLGADSGALLTAQRNAVIVPFGADLALALAATAAGTLIGARASRRKPGRGFRRRLLPRLGEEANGPRTGSRSL